MEDKYFLSPEAQQKISTSRTLKAEGGGQGAKTGLYAMRGRANGQQLEKSGDYTNSLTTVQKDNLWLENSRIRKLTPRECERLQGFPDDWTKVKMSNGKFMSDTQRYKQMGNAVTVNVVQAIMEEIITRKK